MVLIRQPARTIAGGAGLTFAKIVKSVDETIDSDIVPHDDLELLFTPTINMAYSGYILLWVTSSVAADFQFRATAPAGATSDKLNGNYAGVADQLTNTFLTTQATAMAAGLRWIRISFRLIMADTAGDFNFQWSQQFSQVDPTTVHRGTTLISYEEGNA